MNTAKNYNLKSFTKWIFVNHPEWCEDSNYSVVSVLVKRVTTLNGEVILSKVIESQDMVLKVSSAECMAAEACLKMCSRCIDEEVYVGF